MDIQTLERTALCVAACDGIDTADLKAGSVSIIHKLHDEAAKRVLAQRDELLEALEYVMNRLVDPNETADAAKNARAVIAKVEGGA